MQIANIDSTGAAQHGLDAVRAVVPADCRAEAVPLAALSRWQIGGPARMVVTPSDVGTLGQLLGALNGAGVRHIIIGDGSNLLFDDTGFDGVVIRIGRALSNVSIRADGQVEAEAGLWVPHMVRAVVSAGLSGIQHAIGIPGTVGGLVVMNGGSQRHGIGEHVVWVEVLDKDGCLHRIGRDALDYQYRSSRLQRENWVVVRVQLQLERGDVGALRRESIAIMAGRRAKFPKVRANCGSVFVSDPALYALIGPPGQAIEHVGLKGVRHGGAQISPDHANFIVNLGGASSGDILRLIMLARTAVADATGIWMDAEVRHVARDGTIRAAHLVPVADG